MKKIILYAIVALIAFKLIGNLWEKITLDEEKEVQKFTQKVEILKTSTDYSDISFTSYQYLTFLEENIDWFTAEQSKSISTDLNYLKDYAESKLDSINNIKIALEKEEKERIELEEEEKEEEKEEEESNAAIEKEGGDTKSSKSEWEIELEKKEKILRINPDTKEGKMVFDTIRKMNYNQMVDRFGSSYGFTEFGGVYECAWSNITMKKKGINIWCTPYFEYSNSLHHLTGYRLSVCD